MGDDRRLVALTKAERDELDERVKAFIHQRYIDPVVNAYDAAPTIADLKWTIHDIAMRTPTSEVADAVLAIFLPEEPSK